MSDIDLLSFSDRLADAVAAAAPWVVQVHGRRRPASGVVYGPRHVLTTSRALGQEDGLRVRTPDGHVLEADLAGWDPTTGLVLLRSDDLQLTPAARSDLEPRVGHLALAIARSWSNAVTATTGIVSVIGGPLPTGPGRAIDRVLRTTAPMHGGFAGGAFIDVRGRLLGIATAASIRGLGVVIPGDIAWAVAARLVEHGTVQRGYLGVSGQPVRIGERLHQHTDGRSHGLLVIGVAAGSPADQAGILIGDLITGFADAPVQSAVDLLELLTGDRIGRQVPVDVLRGGRPEQLLVTVGRAERQMAGRE
jgi:S1-C subfamily serine protease